MANKALITRRAAVVADVPMRSAIAATRPGAIVVEADTPAGLLIRGAESDYEALAAAGFRVKLLPDTHLLRIGRYTIDVTADAIPDVPGELDVTAAELSGWPHHIVQLIGPPLEAWVREIEARGVDVVEPLSEYALFVYTTADLANALRDLPFVAWTGPLKPAYRIAPSAPPTTDYVSVSVYPSSEADRVGQSIAAAQGRILDELRQPAVYGGEYAIFRVQGATLDALARIPHVRWVEAVPRMQPEEPVRRFQTAHDVAFALRSFGTSTAAHVVAIPETRSAVRRHAAAALAAATLGGVALVAWLLSNSTPRMGLGNGLLTPFAVEAGAEHEPAWSPDGKSLAYVRGGDDTGEWQLVVQDLGASDPVVIHRSSMAMTAPFWAPPGDRVYFVEGYRTLRSIAAIGGEVRTVVTGMHGADIAPDGETFAVIKATDAPGRSTQLMVGPLSALRPYDPEPVTSVCSPNLLRFSPDGQHLLFWDACAQSVVVLAMPGQHAARSAMRVIDLPPAEGAPVLATQPGGGWWPDSHHMVLAHGGVLWLASIERGLIGPLTNGTTAAMFPSVAHDGTVAFTEYIIDHDVIEIPLDGGVPTTLVGSDWYDGSPTWSPQGDRFAYVADWGRGDELRVRHATERTERRLLGVRDFPERVDALRAATYSPDGLWVAVSAFSIGQTTHSGIWVVSANGGTPRLVSPKDLLALRASWSPDGRALATETLRPGGAEVELWIIGVGTSQAPRQLALPAGVDVRYTEWSPDGSTIAVIDGAAPRDSATLLIDPQSGDTRRLPSLQSAAVTWSRDSKRLYGVAAPETATEVRALDVTSGAVHTVSRLSTPLHIGEIAGQSLRMWLHPSGRSLISSSFANRSNIWLMTGIELPQPKWRSLWAR